MLKKLRPARSMNQEAVVVSDLDALVDTPVAFKFQGETHVINPLTAGEFLQVYEAFAKIEILVNEKNITAQEVVEAYTELFSSVCKTITKRHVEEMTQAQSAALFQLVLQSVTGKAQVEAQKKNPQIGRAHV